MVHIAQTKSTKKVVKKITKKDNTVKTSSSKVKPKKKAVKKTSTKVVSTPVEPKVVKKTAKKKVTKKKVTKKVTKKKVVSTPVEHKVVKKTAKKKVTKKKVAKTTVTKKPKARSNAKPKNSNKKSLPPMDFIEIPIPQSKKSIAKKAIDSLTKVTKELGLESSPKSKKMTFASILKNPVYKNRDAIYQLVPPKGLVHRVQQKNELIMELAPILMNSAVPSIFVYGNPGTGKTALISELLAELQIEANTQKIPIRHAYVNCSENRTETTIIIDILSQLNPSRTYPRLGWTRAKAISEFTILLNLQKSNVLLVLDEIDYALKESGDDILYRLSRINSTIKSSVSSILISNDIRVADYIKPKTQSTLGRVKIIFTPYTAEEIEDILASRVSVAFHPGVVSVAVVKKIAEIESQRGGDARKALELLDSCAKIALAKDRSQITLDLVDAADTTLEKDTVLNTISTLTKQQKILLLAMLKSTKQELDSSFVYKSYIETCKKHNMEPLSVRRIRTFIVNFDEMGLLDSEVTWLRSLNKKGRKINLSMDAATKKKSRKLIRDTI